MTSQVDVADQSHCSILDGVRVDEIDDPLTRRGGTCAEESALACNHANFRLLKPNQLHDIKSEKWCIHSHGFVKDSRVKNDCPVEVLQAKSAVV